MNTELISLKGKHVDTNKAGHRDRARFPLMHDASVMQLWVSWCEDQLVNADCMFDITQTGMKTLHKRFYLHIFYSGL